MAGWRFPTLSSVLQWLRERPREAPRGCQWQGRHTGSGLFSGPPRPPRGHRRRTSPAIPAIRRTCGTAHLWSDERGPTPPRAGLFLGAGCDGWATKSRRPPGRLLLRPQGAAARRLWGGRKARTRGGAVGFIPATIVADGSHG